MKFPKIDWPRTVAGALAAVAAAILLSKLGAAGTLIGAAIGSLVISIGTNVGAHGIQSTRERMLEAQREAVRRVSEAQEEVRRARQQVANATDESKERLAAVEGALESAQSELAKDVPTSDIPVVAAPIAEEPAAHVSDDATRVLPAADESPANESFLKRIRWKQAAIFAVASFVIALVAITAFELIGGRPLASYTGGNHDSSGTTLGGGSVSKPRKPAPRPKVTPSPTVTPSATVTPSPSVTPSATPSASASATDSTTPSATPSATDSSTPSDSATPTAPATSGATP